MKEDPCRGDKKSMNCLSPIGGYQQSYIIKYNNNSSSNLREVFFRCGNWCYEGSIPFDFLSNKSMTLEDLPKVVPVLQRQQDDLSFSCVSSRISDSSSFAPVLEVVQEAQDCFTTELTTSTIVDKMKHFETNNPWIQNEKHSYFELIGDLPSSMNDIECICSKTYSRGLVIVLMYFEGVFYNIIQDGEGDQPILDVEFPDVSQEGDGITLALYDDNTKGSAANWRKLSMWQSLSGDTGSNKSIRTDCIEKSRTKDLSSALYQQTYCVLKPDGSDEDESFREVLFRFGSWCYSGKAELVPKLSLVDIPYVMPALRVQQDKLSFLCDVSQMPNKSMFTTPLEYTSKVRKLMEEEMMSCNEVIKNLVSGLEKMGLGRSAKAWLEGDSAQTFFEFSLAHNEASVLEENRIDIIATKSYNPNGLVVMSIYFGGAFYLCISEGDDEQNLLDSQFPSIIQGRGYQLRSYPSGLKDWPELRKLSIWQNSESVENELRDELSEEQTPSENINISEPELVPETAHDGNNTKLTERDEEMTVDKFQKMDNALSSSISLNISVPDSKEYPEVKKDTSCVHLPETIYKEQSTTEKKERKIYYRSKKQDLSYEVDENHTASSPLEDLSSDKYKSTRQNLGAFHHLAPLGKTSKLKDRMKSEARTGNGVVEKISAPWDMNGRPLI